MSFKYLKLFFSKIFFPKPPLPPYKHVCQAGDPILRTIAENVPLQNIQTSDINMIISNMVKVMRHYKSFGLSAPQIGVPLRIIVMEIRRSEIVNQRPETCLVREMSELPLSIFINPELKVLSYDTKIFPEGCESLRGYSGNVARYSSVQLSGYDAEGNALTRSFSGWSARIAQHEMDHLQGKLCIDKMDLKSFQNDAWHRINVHSGRIKIVFN